MASIHHPLSIPTVKVFAWSFVKKASYLTALMQKQDLEISGIINSRNRTVSLIKNLTILIVVYPGWLTLLCMNNNLLCWKKYPMIWSWQWSLTGWRLSILSIFCKTYHNILKNTTIIKPDISRFGSVWPDKTV